MMKRVLSALGCRAVKLWKGFVRVFYGNAASAVGTSVLLLYIFVALFGPLIFPYENVVDTSKQLLPPSLSHPFGTDNLGRDVFRQLISGTGDILTVAFLTAVITILAAVTLGMVAGLRAGLIDRLISFVTSVFLTIPSLPVFLILAAIFTIEDNWTFALILSLFNWAGLARAVRSQVISLKERDFIQICKVMKMSDFHIIFREIMPNIASYILINFIIIMKNAITGSVSLMLLGVVALDPANWGAVLNAAKGNGALVDPSAYMWLFAPILCIAFFQFGVIILTRGLDETLNPRLRVQ